MIRQWERTSIILLVLVNLVFVPGHLLAQNGIPSAPAFSFVGASPTEVSSPVTARALGVDLLNAIGPSGEVQQGLALDFAPWSLIPGLRITLQDYQEKPLSYLFANMKASVAALKSSGATSDTDIGLGLRVVVLDDGDFMRDPEFIQSADRRRELCPEPAQPEDLLEYQECLDQAFLAAVDEWRIDRAWNPNALSFALATGFRLADSQVQNAKWLGLGVWATGSLRLGSWGQLASQAKYEFRQESSGDMLNHILTAGVRAIVGGRKFAASAEYVAHMNLTQIEADWYSDRVSVALEYRVGDSLWLSSGLCGSVSHPDERVSLLSSLNWEVLPGPILRMRSD